MVVCLASRVKYDIHDHYSNCGFAIDVEFTSCNGYTFGRQSIAAGPYETYPFEPKECDHIASDMNDKCNGTAFLFFNAFLFFKVGQSRAPE